MQDVSAGAWVHEGLSLFADGHRGHLVGDVVPPVFEAYARVFHPAHRRTGPAAGEVEPVTWHEVAEANGRIAHPLMEWDFITAAPHRGQGQPGLWDRPGDRRPGRPYGPRPHRRAHRLYRDCGPVLVRDMGRKHHPRRCA